jgi:hypothetical protein
LTYHHLYKSAWRSLFQSRHCFSLYCLPSLKRVGLKKTTDLTKVEKKKKTIKLFSYALIISWRSINFDLFKYNLKTKNAICFVPFHRISGLY